MKLSLTLIPLFFSLCLRAQIVSVSYQPLDCGLGLKYDQCFERSSVYISATKGNYRFGKEYIENHVKLSSGVNARTENGFIGFGVCYATYGKRYGTFNDKVFEPVSFEFNSGVYFGRVVVGARYDLVKHEATVDLGIRL